MAVSEENYQLILKYLNDDLNNQEMRQFKKLKHMSADFAREVANADAAPSALNSSIRNTRIHNGDLIESWEESTEFNRPFGWVLLALFAIVASLGALFLFNLSEPYDTDTLLVFDTYFEEFPVSVTTDDVMSDKGINLYIAGKYSEAIPFLRDLAVDPKHPVASLYLANAYIKVDDFTNAELTLESLLVDEETWYLAQHKYWYLGLIYTRQNRIALAIEVFRKLSFGGGLYARRSAEIVDLINH
ncbi:MAG: tetratricopeptide repeat protein [Bacteroidota bacterium]